MLYVRQIYVYVSNSMKKPQNDSLYKVGTKYDTDSINLKKANKLPKVKNILHRTSLQTRQTVMHPLVLTSAISQSTCMMDIDFQLHWWLQSQNISSLCWAMSQFPSLISPFPHFPFLISHFLVPTFRVTPFLCPLKTSWKVVWVRD